MWYMRGKEWLPVPLESRRSSWARERMVYGQAATVLGGWKWRAGNQAGGRAGFLAACARSEKRANEPELSGGRFGRKMLEDKGLRPETGGFGLGFVRKTNPRMERAAVCVEGGAGEGVAAKME